MQFLVVLWQCKINMNIVIHIYEECPEIPVNIPNFSCTVHGGSSEKVPTRMPRTTPNCMNVICECQNAFCLGKIPDLHS